MATVDRIGSLKAKHAALEAEIAELKARPHPDDDTLATLKRQKLRVKDEIAGLSRSH